MGLIALVGFIAASWIRVPPSPALEQLDLLGPVEYSSTKGLSCEDLPVGDLENLSYEPLRLRATEVTSRPRVKVCQVTPDSRAEPGRLRVTLRLYETPVEAYRWFAARQGGAASPQDDDGWLRSSELDAAGSATVVHSNASVMITPTTELVAVPSDTTSRESYFHIAEWILGEL